MCRSVGCGVAGSAAAAGPCGRPTERRRGTDFFCGARLFLQPCTGGNPFLRAGEPSGALWTENDPCAALGNVAEADAAACQHARGAESRRGDRAVFWRCGYRGGAFYLRNYQHGSGRVPHRFDSCGYRGEKYRTGAGFAAGGAAVCRIHAPCAKADALRAVR